jgi:hypothetical protein
MKDSIKFRRYAEECRRLANSTPEHKTILLEIADAWIHCGEDAEGIEKKGGSADHSDK